jgi:REP element-mobilizing transposase RayT
MARKLRIQYPGAIYHVMNRGDRREAIFEDDEDRQRWLKTLGEACEKTGWQVHAYCLMGNHFHVGTRGHLAWLLQHRGQSRLAASTDQCLLRI